MADNSSSWGQAPAYFNHCLWCVLATCRVTEGLSRSEQLVGYFYSAPLLDVAYCLVLPWLALCITPASGQPSLFASTNAGAASRLDTARSRCLQRSPFTEDTVEPSLSFLFIVCVGTIRNNSLVGGPRRRQDRVEPQPLSASRTTAHGGRVR